MKMLSKRVKITCATSIAMLVGGFSWASYREHTEAREKKKSACYEALYLKAHELERAKDLVSAIGIYSYLCEGVFYKPGNEREHPCAGASRISGRFAQVYKETMQALSSYKERNGVYPSSLNEVIPDVPLSSREVAERFRYCKKESPNDRSAKCPDGTIYFGEGEISIGTGEYGGVSFSLRKSNSPIDPGTPAACRSS